MADEQPSGVHEGATSAEDRKAASALANLDASNTDDSSTQNIDQDAINQAMKRLGGASAIDAIPKPSTTAAAAASKSAAPPAKAVKVDAADVTLLVNELELPKPKATELLKAHEGDAVKAIRAYVSV